MPKLDKRTAAAVASADAATGSLLLDEGYYAAQLRSVEQRDGTEYPYWVWEFHNIHDAHGNKRPGRAWNNTSLSPKSHGFLKASFEAFGYTSDTDTEEIINDGAWVVLYLTVELVEKGPRAGQKRNNVQSLSEFIPGNWEFDPEAESVNAGGYADGGGGDEF